MLTKAPATKKPDVAQQVKIMDALKRQFTQGRAR